MKSIVVAITCQHCGFVTHKKSETLLIAGFEEEYRKELLAETFFKKNCPVCGKEISFLHPVLYVDKEHRFALLIKSQKDQSETDQSVYETAPGLRKRYISDSAMIIEKLRILEDELDDRAIEIIKAKLYARYQKRYPDLLRLQYHDRDANSHTIWFDLIKDEPDLIAIEESVYQRIASQQPREGEDFVEIDISWVMKQ